MRRRSIRVSRDDVQLIEAIRAIAESRSIVTGRARYAIGDGDANGRVGHIGTQKGAASGVDDVELQLSDGIAYGDVQTGLALLAIEQWLLPRKEGQSGAADHHQQDGGDHQL